MGRSNLTSTNDPGPSPYPIRQVIESGLHFFSLHNNNLLTRGLQPPPLALVGRLNPITIMRRAIDKDQNAGRVEKVGDGDRFVFHVGMFLSNLTVRKVMAGQSLLRLAGTLTKNLARWLEEKG